MMASTTTFQSSTPGRDSRTETLNGTSSRRLAKKMKMFKKFPCTAMELTGSSKWLRWCINPKSPVSSLETETRTSLSFAL